MQDPARKEKSGGQQFRATHGPGHGFGMDGMHGVQQRGGKGHRFAFESGSEQLLQQDIKQPSRPRVQQEIQQMISERVRPIERPIGRQCGEGDWPKHSAYRIRREQPLHGRIGHLRIAKNIEFVVHGELIRQRVAVDEHHGSQKQSGEESFLHARPIMRCKRGVFPELVWRLSSYRYLGTGQLRWEGRANWSAFVAPASRRQFSRTLQMARMPARRLRLEKPAFLRAEWIATHPARVIKEKKLAVATHSQTGGRA